MINLAALAVLLPPTAAQVQELSIGLPKQVPLSVATAIADAVASDEETPLGGSLRAEAALMVVYAWHESNYKACAAGDSGRSLGIFQLQRLPRVVACDPGQAARIWLARAHDSYTRCEGVEEDARLAALASGNCGHGHVLARSRQRLALGLASR